MPKVPASFTGPLAVRFETLAGATLPEGSHAGKDIASAEEGKRIGEQTDSKSVAGLIRLRVSSPLPSASNPELFGVSSCAHRRIGCQRQ